MALRFHFLKPRWLWCLLLSCSPSLGWKHSYGQRSRSAAESSCAFLGFNVCYTDLLVVVFSQVLFISCHLPAPSGALQFDVVRCRVLITRWSWKLMLNLKQRSWRSRVYAGVLMCVGNVLLAVSCLSPRAVLRLAWRGEAGACRRVPSEDGERGQELWDHVRCPRARGRIGPRSPVSVQPVINRQPNRDPLSRQLSGM